MCGLLENFWAHQQVVLGQNGYHGPAFLVTQGNIQDGLMYPALFNMVVENIIRTWLAMTVEDQRLVHDGLGEAVGWCLGF